MKYDPELKITNTRPLPVFRIASWGWRLVCPEQPARDFRLLLRHRLARLSGNNPVTIMVHGGGFSPFSHRSDAQETLFSRHMGPERWQSRSWLKRFAATNLSSNETLAITFAWNGIRSEILSKPNHGAMFDAATAEVAKFGSLVNELALIDPDRPINIICHGLGARIVMQCFHHLSGPHVDKIIILAGHEFCADTLSAISHKHAKRTQFFNIRSPATLKMDRRADAELPKSGPKDQLLALGFPFHRPNWVDFDTARTTPSKPRTGWFKTPGFKRRFCKWSFGPERAIDDMIARIIHNAPNTSVQHIRDRLFTRQIIPKVNDAKPRFGYFVLMSPLRRRKAM